MKREEHLILTLKLFDIVQLMLYWPTISISGCLNSISIHMVDGLSKRTTVPIAYADTNSCGLYIYSKAIVEGQRITNLKVHRKSGNTGITNRLAAIQDTPLASCFQLYT